MALKVARPEGALQGGDQVVESAAVADSYTQTVLQHPQGSGNRLCCRGCCDRPIPRPTPSCSGRGAGGPGLPGAPAGAAPRSRARARHASARTPCCSCAARPRRASRGGASPPGGQVRGRAGGRAARGRVAGVAERVVAVEAADDEEASGPPARGPVGAEPQERRPGGRQLGSLAPTPSRAELRSRCRGQGALWPRSSPRRVTHVVCVGGLLRRRRSCPCPSA